MDLERLLQQIEIGEDQDFEFKSAEGGLPQDMWETVSAFANTEGGYIVLGVTQKKHTLSIAGVKNTGAKLKAFWDNHNNPQKLSSPICSNSDVEVVNLEGNDLIIIKVPKADRKQRPVYINNNPMTGTFKRNHEGDYRCYGDEVKQMLRDSNDDPQDFQILEGFALEDLDSATLKAFRQRFSSRDPDHPWLAKNDRDLLEQLGGWRRDRITKKEGLTVAGLLMFGRERSIQDAFPNYQLDYQEQMSEDPEQRWTYRLTLDGKWEPNLFNFYYQVYVRLVQNLDVPFQLDKDAVRRGETHVHEALREALVNSLIHADHLSSRPLKIIKIKDLFLFSNPGRLRIPIERLYEGGVSDPRNPNLQKMFQMLGLGEKAGSGFQKILRAWKEQQWLFPLVSEKLDLDITSVALSMTSLIPENVEKELKEIVGEHYCELTELDRLVLVAAHEFKAISNGDIQRYRKEHPKEIGDCLKRLVNKGYLKQSGRGRGTQYTLSDREKSNGLLLTSDSEHFSGSSEHLPENSEHFSESSEHLPENSEHYQHLLQIAAPVRDNKHSKKEIVRQIIQELCSGQYLSLQTLAELLGRNRDSIRNHYITPMLSEGLLELKHPELTNHPQQAYKTVLSKGSSVV
jgi:ATP-dependent DNA helicase RecG